MKKFDYDIDEQLAGAHNISDSKIACDEEEYDDFIIDEAEAHEYFYWNDDPKFKARGSQLSVLNVS